MTVIGLWIRFRRDTASSLWREEWLPIRQERLQGLRQRVSEAASSRMNASENTVWEDFDPNSFVASVIGSDLETVNNGYDQKVLIEACYLQIGVAEGYYESGPLTRWHKLPAIFAMV